MSGALLERMGYTVEQYERVCLNALLVSPGAGGMHAAVNGHSDHALHNGGVDTRRQAGGNRARTSKNATLGAYDGRVGNAGASGDQGVCPFARGWCTPRTIGNTRKG